MLASLFTVSCKHNGRDLLQKQYTLARLEFQRGHDDQARQSAQEGLDRSAKYPDLNWEFRILQAEILLRHESPTEAVQAVGAAMPAGLPPEVSRRRALVLGSAQCKLGNTPETGLDFAEAKRLAGSNLSFQAEVAVAEGRCNILTRNFDAAEEHFQQALQSAQVDDFTRLDASHGLALCALRRRKNELGVDLMLRVLKASRAQQNDYFEERALGGLGYAYAELGVFTKALENSRAAEELAGKLHQTQDQQKWQLDVGRAYILIGQWGPAKEFFRKAMATAASLHDSTVVIGCLHNLAEIEIGHGSLQRAEDFHEQAGKLNPQGDDLLYWKLDEAVIASRKGNLGAGALLLALLPQIEKLPRLTWSVESELAQLYDRQGDPARADEWFQRSIKTIDDATAPMQKVALKIATRDSSPIIGDYIAFLVAHNQPERSLQASQLARARSLADELGVKKPPKERSRAWVARVQAMLRAKKQIALAYFNSEAGAYVWVVSPTHLQVKKLATQQDELETLTASYVREIADHTDLASSSAQRKLYQLLVKPVIEFIPPGSHVVLVGDSALYRINFETLISDEGQPHYWIDDVEIENASSLDLLLAGQTLQRKGRGMLLVSAPEEVDPNYPKLPNAPLEMEAVRKHFPAADVKVFSGKEAVPEAYTGGHPGRFKYIDFATHGTADTEDPMNSAVILSKGPHGTFQLYARDIVKPELKLNADLVTISTCYGAGKGGAASEGLMGLQRAFLRAGAHQVIAALWNVSDEISPAIMDRLYEGIAAHESASQALRAAKLKLVHSGDYHHTPYYWAPLQVYTGR